MPFNFDAKRGLQAAEKLQSCWWVVADSLRAKMHAISYQILHIDPASLQDPVKLAELTLAIGEYQTLEALIGKVDIDGQQLLPSMGEQLLTDYHAMNQEAADARD